MAYQCKSTFADMARGSKLLVFLLMLLQPSSSFCRSTCVEIAMKLKLFMVVEVGALGSLGCRERMIDLQRVEMREGLNYRVIVASVGWLHGGDDLQFKLPSTTTMMVKMIGAEVEKIAGALQRWSRFARDDLVGDCNSCCVR